MRILALPAAVLLAFCLFPALPRAGEWIDGALRALHRCLRAHLHRAGKTNESSPLIAYLFILCVSAALLSALHPVVCSLVMAPLFSAPSLLPSLMRVKEELDSGAYAGNIPEYERRVRAACLSLAHPFARRLAMPLLLCAVGMPVYLGCALGWGYTALLAVQPQEDVFMRASNGLQRAADRLFCALLSMCAGVVGRNPFRISGSDVQTRLIQTLGIAGDAHDTHAPVSGDIAQGVFLCCFCCAVLCLLLVILLIPLC